MQLRIFLLQRQELKIGAAAVAAFRQQKLIGHYRQQKRRRGRGLASQTLTGLGMRQAGNGTDASCFDPFHRLVFISGVDADLIDLFLPDGFGLFFCGLRRQARRRHRGLCKPVGLRLRLVGQKVFDF